MCVYGKDNPDHFDTAINSIVNQTKPPTEVVLTVDGPIPNTIESVIEKYISNLSGTDISFNVVRLEKNMGHGEARRICFEHCNFPLIALMDSDDISKEDRFEKETKLFSDDLELAIVGSHVSEFFGSPDNIQSIRKVELTDKLIKRDMAIRCPMNQPTVMFKKEAVAAVGGYLDWFCNEDYYLWIRLAQAGYKFANIDDCLVNMRVDEKSYERRGGKKYFDSEVGIQKLLLNNKMVTPVQFIINVCKRFLVQICLPNSLRAWAFHNFARKNIKEPNP